MLLKKAEKSGKTANKIKNDIWLSRWNFAKVFRIVLTYGDWSFGADGIFEKTHWKNLKGEKVPGAAQKSSSLWIDILS